VGLNANGTSRDERRLYVPNIGNNAVFREREIATWLCTAIIHMLKDLDSRKLILEPMIEREHPYTCLRVLLEGDRLRELFPELPHMCSP
jgi:hypothetical protein